jgi:hypothetical protein
VQLRRHYTEVSDQVHTPAALPPGTEPKVPVGGRVGLDAVDKRKTCTAGNRTRTVHSHQKLKERSRSQWRPMMIASSWVVTPYSPVGIQRPRPDTGLPGAGRFRRVTQPQQASHGEDTSSVHGTPT